MTNDPAAKKKQTAHRNPTFHRQYTLPYLSDYAGRKIWVKCGKCPLRKRYDANTLLAKIGDVCMHELIGRLARAEGCPKVDNISADRCNLHYDIKAMGELIGDQNRQLR
ncbi:hypothetical protein [Sinorhizobium sp. BG8]|uniref:hypothetical protein n=1 Tax=Sinorhizobium sp. BG8 TaxID=2613773 RepID=UPI00193DB24C|nr:hypothetical protein [Sinorhizobium sp. BG8]QRM57189.1 hypothetical protein F3Y30_21965 [Sinorhizobium sp. BG8]